MKKGFFWLAVSAMLLCLSCTPSQSKAEKEAEMIRLIDSLKAADTPATEQAPAEKAVSPTSAQTVFPQALTGTVVDPDGHSNMRSSPTMNATVIEQVNEGQKIYLIGKSGNWYKVRTERGVEGFVHQNLVVTETGTGFSKNVNEVKNRLSQCLGRLNISIAPYGTERGGVQNVFVNVFNGGAHTIDIIETEIIYEMADGYTQSQIIEIENILPNSKKTGFHIGNKKAVRVYIQEENEVKEFVCHGANICFELIDDAADSKELFDVMVQKLEKGNLTIFDCSANGG